MTVMVMVLVMGAAAAVVHVLSLKSLVSYELTKEKADNNNNDNRG